jgi:hypothetical protein
MPSPILSAQLAITQFQGYRIQLPAAGADRAATLVKPDLARVPLKTAPVQGGMPVPPALFLAASGSPADVRYQKEMHEKYMRFFEGLTEAVKHAWNLWRQNAYFEGLTIMAVTATGRAGCLKGPSLEKFIKAAPSVAAWTGELGAVRDGLAAGFQKSWAEWQSNVTVPGLPWYPRFAAWPARQTTPSPNDPTPLTRCLSRGVAAMGAGTLKYRLVREISGKTTYHEQFSSAMSSMISTAFTQWLPAQMVTNVLAKGPVPSFAPPYVPVGPVVGGDNIAAPGHLMT